MQTVATLLPEHAATSPCIQNSLLRLSPFQAILPCLARQCSRALRLSASLRSWRGLGYYRGVETSLYPKTHHIALLGTGYEFWGRPSGMKPVIYEL